MEEQNASLDFQFKKIDETRNCLSEEIKHNKLIIKKHKKTCTTLNYIEHLLILFSTVTGHVSIFPFASLFGIALDIASSAVGLKIYATAAGFKKHTSTVKKKKEKSIIK